MCPVPDSKRKKEILPRELFVKGVDECVGFRVTQCLLHQNGEPLLAGAREIAWRLAYAKSKLPDSIVGFFTNGSLMDTEATEVILDAKPDFIAFSFDGGTKETYEKIRKGLSYDVVKSNILHFGKRKVERNMEKPMVQIIMVPQQSNIHTYDGFMRTFKGQSGLNMVGAGGLCNYGGQIEAEDKVVVGQYANGRLDAPCWRLYTFLIIGSNGKPLLCCNDVDIPIDLGDLRTMTMQQIWQGTAFKSVRCLSLLGKQKDIPLCDKCDWMKSFKEPDWWYKDGYEKIF